MTAPSDILRFMTAGRPDAAPEAETSDAREASDAAVAADRRRVEQLYVRLEVKLTNVVVRWLWNREEARDVLQEAFVRLWRMRARIDWGRVEPLVFRITLNLAAKPAAQSPAVNRSARLRAVRETDRCRDARTNRRSCAHTCHRSHAHERERRQRAVK